MLSIFDILLDLRMRSKYGLLLLAVPRIGSAFMREELSQEVKMSFRWIALKKTWIHGYGDTQRSSS